MEYWLPEEIWAIVKGYLLYEKSQFCGYASDSCRIKNPKHFSLFWRHKIVGNYYQQASGYNGFYICSSCWYNMMELQDEKRMKTKLNLTTREYHLLVGNNKKYDAYNGYYLFETHKNQEYNEKRKNIIKYLIDRRKKLIYNKKY